MNFIVRKIFNFLINFLINFSDIFKSDFDKIKLEHKKSLDPRAFKNFMDLGILDYVKNLKKYFNEEKELEKEEFISIIKSLKNDLKNLKFINAEDILNSWIIKLEKINAEKIRKFKFRWFDISELFRKIKTLSNNYLESYCIENQIDPNNFEDFEDNKNTSNSFNNISHSENDYKTKNSNDITKSKLFKVLLFYFYYFNF